MTTDCSRVSRTVGRVRVGTGARGGGARGAGIGGGAVRRRGDLQQGRRADPAAELSRAATAPSSVAPMSAHHLRRGAALGAQHQAADPGSGTAWASCRPGSSRRTSASRPSRTTSRSARAEIETIARVGGQRRAPREPGRHAARARLRGHGTNGTSASPDLGRRLAVDHDGGRGSRTGGARSRPRRPGWRRTATSRPCSSRRSVTSRAALAESSSFHHAVHAMLDGEGAARADHRRPPRGRPQRRGLRRAGRPGC